MELKFGELKRRLLVRPIVRLPNIKRNFNLKTNASTVAVGAVLRQKIDVTKLEHPVAFLSYALCRLEQNYCANELEIYAVFRAAEHIKIYHLYRK